MSDFFRKCLKRCESPAEKDFLEALVGYYRFAEVLDQEPIIGRTLYDIFLIQQAEVDKYRIDFALYHSYIPPFVVEIDGFTHHGSNPNQFEKDKKRERALVSLGYQFLRFSGREIHYNAVRCAIEAMSIVELAVLREKHVEACKSKETIRNLGWNESVPHLKEQTEVLKTFKLSDRIFVKRDDAAFVKKKAYFDKVRRLGRVP